MRDTQIPSLLSSLLIYKLGLLQTGSRQLWHRRIILSILNRQMHWWLLVKGNTPEEPGSLHLGQRKQGRMSP